MGKKRNRDDKMLKQVALITAIISLATGVIELLSKIIEWLTER